MQEIIERKQLDVIIDRLQDLCEQCEFSKETCGGTAHCYTWNTKYVNLISEALTVEPRKIIYEYTAKVAEWQNDSVEVMNEMGKEGWQAINVLRRDEDYLLYFMREKT